MSDSDPLHGATRIMIYGVTGSGKSTLAGKISGRSGIQWHSVDDLTFDPNWAQVPVEIQRERIAKICAEVAWIVDTAYAVWKDIPLSRVQLIVALDYPRWLSFRRLLFRTLGRCIDKRPICNGNVETLKGTFSKDSILLWHFRSFKRKRARILEWCDEVKDAKVLRFTHPRETQKWLESINRLPQV